MAVFILGDVARRSGRDQLAALVAAFRPQINYPINRFYYIQIVFNDQHGIAFVRELMQDREQAVDVVEMQAGGRFVQDIQSLAGGAAGQLIGQLDPLRLAAGQGGGRLAEPDIAETDLV